MGIQHVPSEKYPRFICMRQNLEYPLRQIMDAECNRVPHQFFCFAPDPTDQHAARKIQIQCLDDRCR